MRQFLLGTRRLRPLPACRLRHLPPLLQRRRSPTRRTDFPYRAADRRTTPRRWGAVGVQPGYAQPGQAPGYGGSQGGYAPGPGGAYDPNYAAGGAYGGGQGNTQAGSTLHRFMHGSLGRTVAMEGGGFAMNEVWGKMGI
jgi:hypothetical protein